jgi:phenylalanyl-tRNA synthetase beta subunit
LKSKQQASKSGGKTRIQTTKSADLNMTQSLLPHYAKQSKYTKHRKNQEKLSSHGKRKSSQANSKMTQMLELSHKDFKAAITQMIL